jgi:uncharacterized membrane protein HdeD (DUF308 family)
MAHGWTEQYLGTPRWRSPSAWVIGMAVSPQDVKRARTWLIVTGVLAILAGIVAVAVPVIASVTIALFIGWVLLVAGIVMGVHAFSHGMQDDRRSVALRVLNALLTVAVGLYILIFPLHGTVTLTFMLAVWFFASGFIGLLAAWQEWGMPGAGWIALNGALSLVLGILIAVNLPSSAGWAIGVLVGINLIFFGLRALVAAQLLKQALSSEDRQSLASR